MLRLEHAEGERERASNLACLRQRSLGAMAVLSLGPGHRRRDQADTDELAAGVRSPTIRAWVPRILIAYFTHHEHRSRRIVNTETTDGERVSDGDGDWLDLFLGGLLGLAAGRSL